MRLNLTSFLIPPPIKPFLEGLIFSGLLWPTLPAIAQGTPPIPSETPTLQAIIHLTTLKVPPPTVQGQGTLKLTPLLDGIAWTTPGRMGDRWGKFLVDTGASRSLISEDFLKGTGLTGKPLPASETQYAFAGQDCPAPTARLFSLNLQFDQAKIKQLQAVQLSQALIPAGLDGVIGMDVLDRFAFTLDPQKQELQLRPPTAPTPKTQPIPFVRRRGVAIAEVWLNQQGPFQFLIDTGAESTFISPQMAQRLQIPAAKLQAIDVEGFCGLESAQFTQLQSVTMGGQTIKPLEVVILSNTNILKVLEIDGIIGQNFLNHFQQYWHFDPSSATGRLWLTPY